MPVSAVAPRRLLVVDPCEACEQFLPHLRAYGWDVVCCGMERIGQQRFDVGALCLQARHLQRALWLGQMLRQSGVEWIALLGSERPPVVEADDFIGACFFECHRLPFDLVRLQRSLVQALATSLLLVSSGCDSTAHGHELLGQSRVMRELRKRLVKMGQGEAPVLIQGEGGSGKTLVARELHRQSRRADGPFVLLNGAALAEAPASEALDRLSDKLAEAAGGSLFLAEIGTLPLALQSALLKRVHGRAVKANVRLLATSRVDLQLAVEQRRFDPRLYAWLSHRLLPIEPLRKRQGDIALLADYFLGCCHGGRRGGRSRALSEEALAAMRRHPWPGNVRELARRVFRGAALAEDAQIEAADLGLESGAPALGVLGTLEEYKRRAEYQALCDALARHGNNLSLAARVLGVSRPTFYRLLHKHQLL